MNIKDYRKVDVAVVGAGHAGMHALDEVRRHTDNVVLISAHAPGTFGAGSGCMLSNLSMRLANTGGRGRQGRRRWLNGSAGVGGCDSRPALGESMAVGGSGDRDGARITGHARFLGPHHLFVDDRIVEAKAIVVATGSRLQVPRRWQRYSDGVLTGEDLFCSDRLPGTVAVIGLGPIGLELGQALTRVGIEVTGFVGAERLALVGEPVIDAEVVQRFTREFPILPGRRVTIERYGKRFRVRTDCESAVVDKLLFASGSEPDSEHLRWERAGVEKGVHGLPYFDPQTLQIPGTNIFMAGDVDGHQVHPSQAADAGRVAGYNATHRLHISLRDEPDMCIVLSDPRVAWVGTRWRKREAVSSASVKIRFRAVGSTAGAGKGPVVLKLYADRRSASLLGGTMIGPGCEDLATLLAGCVQRRLTICQALHQLDRRAVFGKALQAGLMALQSQLMVAPAASDARAGRGKIAHQESGFATI